MSVSETPLGGAVLTVRPEVVATVLDDGAVLLDLESKYFYALNSSAWALMQLLEAGASVDEVEARCEAWGAPSDGSVRTFVGTLRDFGLLEEIARAEAPGRDPVPFPSVPWTLPVVERQAEPLQQVIVSAFDPSIPLAE